MTGRPPSVEDGSPSELVVRSQMQKQVLPRRDQVEDISGLLETMPLGYEPDDDRWEELSPPAQARVRATILDALVPLQELTREAATDANYVSAVHSDDNGLYRFFRSMT